MDEETSIDFTSGSPIKKLFLFSLPLVAIMILESLYNTADSIIVGRYVGQDALSAVSSVGTLSSLVMMLVYGACTGISVIISQYAGAKNALMVKRSAITGTYFIAVLSIVLGAAGTILAPRLLTLINVPDDIRDDALLYLRVILLGTPVFSFYSMADAVSRAMGDSVTPMIVLIVSAVINIALNMLFVVVFHMAVAGVAYATVIAEGISAVVCAVIIWHKLPLIRPNRESVKPDRTVLKNIVRLGVPSVLESSTSSVGNVAVAALLNTFGSTVIGAYNSALKIEMLVSYAPGGFTGGMQVWTGQNLGAGKPERVKKGYNATVAAIAVYSLFSAPVGYTAGAVFATARYLSGRWKEKSVVSGDGGG